jgi:hypothetical protein
LRHAGAQGLGGGADPALVDDGLGVREDQRVRRIAAGDHALGQDVGQHVAVADQEDGAAFQRQGHVEAVAVEVARIEHHGGAQGEDQRRRPVFEELGQLRRQRLGLAVLAVVEGEAADGGAGGEVRLQLAEHPRIERDGAVRRKLPFEQGIAKRARETEFASQLAHRRGPSRCGESGQAHEDRGGRRARAEPWVGEARRDAKRRRIIGRHEGEGRQRRGNPG